MRKQENMEHLGTTDTRKIHTNSQALLTKTNESDEKGSYEVQAYWSRRAATFRKGTAPYPEPSLHFPVEKKQALGGMVGNTITLRDLMKTQCN